MEIETQDSRSGGPLKGVRVIEFTGLGAAPFGAMMLADMGADVIRIDRSGVPDVLGWSSPRFDIMSRGRRSVALDLKRPGAVDTALRLVERADILLEGFRPGVMERLGLGPDVCLERNPSLVYGRMTGWGQDGPLAQASGHDINYVALSGVLHAIGEPDRPPRAPLNVVGDFGGGGLLLAFGVVCAVLEARSSGTGQVVDAAMVEGASLLASMMWGLFAEGRWNLTRGANTTDGGAHFYSAYECADGKYISVASAEPHFYALLREKLGLQDAVFDAQLDPSQWPMLKQRMATLFRTRTRDEWCVLLEGTDVCFAPVLDWAEAPQHPQALSRGSFIDVAGVKQPHPAPRFSRTLLDTPRPAVAPGAHTEEILREAGFDDLEIDRLRRGGAIFAQATSTDAGPDPGTDCCKHKSQERAGPATSNGQPPRAPIDR